MMSLMSMKKPDVSIEAIVVLRNCVCLQELLKLFLKASGKFKIPGIVAAFLYDMRGCVVPTT